MRRPNARSVVLAIRAILEYCGLGLGFVPATLSAYPARIEAGEKTILVLARPATVTVVPDTDM